MYALYWQKIFGGNYTLQDSKVFFSNQGLFTKCDHIIDRFPLVPLFVLGLIVVVYGQSKLLPLDFYWGNK